MITLPPLPALQDILDMEVYEAINHLESLQVYVSRPHRPYTTSHKPSHSELLDLAERTKVYDKDMIKYQEDNGKANIHNMRVDALIHSLICEKSGLYSIPHQYQNKVFSYAWSKWHSSGHYEVYQELVNLVEIFDTKNNS